MLVARWSIDSKGRDKTEKPDRMTRGHMSDPNGGTRLQARKEKENNRVICF